MAIEIGLKLDPGPLFGSNWPADLSPPERLLKAMAGWGVDFVEIPWGDDRPWEPVEHLVDLCGTAGLGASLHPYLHSHLAPEIFDRTGPTEGHVEILDRARRMVDRTGQAVTLVFHGGVAQHQPHTRSIPAARQAGRKFVEWLGDQASRRSGIEAFLETQVPDAPDNRGIVRIGETWRSCLKLVRQTACGICWDLGHAFIAAEYGKHTAVPPPEFVCWVGHVHAHDVARHGEWLRDHRPLGDGVSRWREDLSLLSGVSFEGRLLLEIDLSEYDRLGDIHSMFSDSAREVRAVFTPPVSVGPSTD
jgi:sugar phosphate isomerase/epimerase